MKKGAFPFPTRYFLVFNTFFLSVLLYVDRACISAAKGDIAEEFSFTDTQMGWIFGAFTLGYAFCQIPSGWFADKFGPRKLLTGVIIAWSIFTGLTGAAGTYVQFLVYRFLFGAGEAGAFPALARATFSWIPMKERGLVTGINFSGSRLGGALAMPLIAVMISQFGWKISFFILAVIGVVWAIYWYAWFRDDPSESGLVGDEEKEYILANRQQQSGEPTPLDLGVLFKSKNVWMAMIQYFASNFTFYFCLSWALPYMKGKFNIGLETAGFLAALPLIGGACGNWFSGAMIDFIYKQDKWVLSRRMPAIMGFLLATIGLTAFVYFDDQIVLAVTFLTIAVFGADMTLSPSWSFCIDIGKEHAGAVSGTMNMVGNIGGFCTMLAFPYLTQWVATNSTTFADTPEKPYFLLAAGLNFMAIIIWMMMKPDRKMEEF